MVDILRWKMSFDGSHLCLKTTFDGRQPSMEDELSLKTTVNGKRPSMEDDILWKTTFNTRRPLGEKKELLNRR